jgi:hypothetical protein
VSTGQYQHLTFRAITMARGQLISMLYDKATDISITAADPTAALTLMSADIERIDTGWRTAHDVWANLVEIAVAVFLLERELGVACLIPVGAAICELDKAWDDRPDQRANSSINQSTSLNHRVCRCCQLRHGTPSHVARSH